MPLCRVKHCRSKWKSKTDDVTLHSFPKERERVLDWLQRIDPDYEDHQELATKIQSNKSGLYRVCSLHFTPDSYEQRGISRFLKRNAIPTLCLQMDYAEEHRYAKKRKIQHTQGACSHDSVPVTAAMEMRTNQAVYSPKQQLIEESNLLLSVERMQFDPIVEVGENYGSDLAISSNGDVALYPKTTAKKFRNISTSTEYFPGQVHKQTQFNRFMGTKNRATQVQKRLPHKSVGIQCEIVPLPMLNTSQLQSGADLVITEAVSSEYLSTPIKNKSPDLFTVHSYTNEDNQILSEFPEASSTTSPKSSEKYDIGAPTKEEQTDYIQEMRVNEDTYVDPFDVDSSYILLPNEGPMIKHEEEKKFLVFESCLDKLIRCCKCQATASCHGTVEQTIKYRVGSAISITAQCTYGHIFHLWRSQPFIGHTPVGNVLICSAVLCSGSNFPKIDTFLNILGLLGICKRTYYKNQRKYLFPTIEHHWLVDRKATIDACANRPIALAGGCQSDSLVYLSKYCLYSFLEHKTNKIIDFQIEQREHGMSFVSLEKKAFQTTLDRLLCDKLNVRVLCTDRGSSIQKLIRHKYNFIKHQFDVWHLSKSVASKLAMASRKSCCSELAWWIEPAKNHMWWAASTSCNDAELLKEKWTSIIYHVTDRHKWDDYKIYHKCHHDELHQSEECKRAWLKAGSPAHSKMKEIIMSKRLLADLEHLSLFYHSGHLEVFHNPALKDKPKHPHHVIDGIVALTQLAILDHNASVDRQQTAMKFQRINAVQERTAWHGITYHKGKKEWADENIYEPNSHCFLKAIISDVLEVARGGKSFKWQSRRQEVLERTQQFHILRKKEILDTF
ncbi:uncharacterized protein [Hyperolius riggenbachi]|uniref:uncharacterized protein n=1 Tax=Hyperolius riggenbachi TaxID=752182 RepID=UPI0035A2E0B0